MKTNLKMLNRDQIKYLAIGLMTLNHIGQIFLEQGTALYEVLEIAGYFTSITMCYFLVEGFSYTHSKKEYAKRLLIFALISEIPYVLAFGYFQLNVLFTFLICFCLLVVLDSGLNRVVKFLSALMLILLSLICDCALILPIATILFKSSKGNRKKLWRAWVIMCVIFFVLNVPGYAPDDAAYPFLSGYALAHSFWAILPWIASAIVIMVFYNGKKSEKHTKMNKWFFYIYYPAHLFLLWVIHLFLF